MSDARVYLFNGRSTRKGIIGCLMERDGLLNAGMFFFLFFSLMFLSAWVMRGFRWDATLGVGLLAILPVLFHLNIVVEIRTDKESLSFRRLGRFRKIPWREIAIVSVSHSRTSGVAHVWITGRERPIIPLALFVLWVPAYIPERWQTVLTLLDEMKSKVPVKLST